MLSVTNNIAVLANILLITLGPVHAQWKNEGCFSGNIGDVTHHNSTMTYNSWLACYNICSPFKVAVMSLNYQDCWCGNLLPATPSKTSPSACQQTCPGYPSNTCGNTVGTKLYSVLLTGLKQPLGSVGGSNPSGDKSSSGGPSTSTPTDPASSASPSYIVKNSTITHTIISGATDPASQASSGSGGGSKAGIAAGVVVGILLLGACIGGIYFFLRQRKRKSIEREHRRQTSINAFANANAIPQPKAPYMTTIPMNDSRLDPILSARRQSDGSIADNVDFSRRVLKVTNPDDRW